MATNLVDYIRVYDNVVSADFCKSVITAFDKDVTHHQRIDRNYRPTFTELNVSQRYIEKDSNWISIQINIQKAFVDYISLYMKDLDLGPDFPAKYCFEEYRIKKYATLTDEFKDHVDVGDHASARRFLVCFLYLNDVSVGGETNFPKLNHAVEPKCGRLLIFPPLWMYRHAGRPVAAGSKYIVGSYLHYL